MRHSQPEINIQQVTCLVQDISDVLNAHSGRLADTLIPPLRRCGVMCVRLCVRAFVDWAGGSVGSYDVSRRRCGVTPLAVPR